MLFRTTLHTRATGRAANTADKYTAGGFFGQTICAYVANRGFLSHIFLILGILIPSMRIIAAEICDKKPPMPHYETRGEDRRRELQ